MATPITMRWTGLSDAASRSRRRRLRTPKNPTARRRASGRTKLAPAPRAAMPASRRPQAMRRWRVGGAVRESATRADRRTCIGARRHPAGSKSRRYPPRTLPRIQSGGSPVDGNAAAQGCFVRRSGHEVRMLREVWRGDGSPPARARCCCARASRCRGRHGKDAGEVARTTAWAASRRSPRWSTISSATSPATSGSTAFSRRRDIPRLKRLLVEQICQAAAGPAPIPARHEDRACRHGHHRCTIQRAGRGPHRSLDKFNVPAKEQGELLGMLGSLKPQIVGQ